MAACVIFLSSVCLCFVWLTRDFISWRSRSATSKRPAVVCAVYQRTARPDTAFIVIVNKILLADVRARGRADTMLNTRVNVAVYR